MHITLDLLWLVIWTTAFMSSFRLIIRLSMTCAQIVAPKSNGVHVTGNTNISTFNLLGTALNWAVIILFYNS